MKYDEFKAMKGVKGFWSWLAFVCTYHTKELFGFIIIVLVGWVLTLIINPSTANTIRLMLKKLIP
jgi:hypothetical protein